MLNGLLNERSRVCGLSADLIQCQDQRNAAVRSRLFWFAYTNGYTLGRADGIKQIYWNLQDRQRDQQQSPSFKRYEVTIPEHWEDDILVQPAKRTLRIDE
jgi:hypothetical protein